MFAYQLFLAMNIHRYFLLPYSKQVFYHLGLAYQYASRFDDAIKTFNTYKIGLKGTELEQTIHQIETCENGKEYVKHPVNVTFQNLGKEINSEFPDYYPFVPANESFVVFTSRRKDNIGDKLKWMDIIRPIFIFQYPLVMFGLNPKIWVEL